MNGTFVRNPDGSLSPAKPLDMVCEHSSCTCNEVKDYVRKKAQPGWEEEPIFLCKKHSRGYERYEPGKK